MRAVAGSRIRRELNCDLIFLLCNLLLFRVIDILKQLDYVHEL